MRLIAQSTTTQQVAGSNPAIPTNAQAHTCHRQSCCIRGKYG